MTSLIPQNDDACAVAAGKGQRQRIRELARNLDTDTVSAIVRRSHRETAAVIEGPP